MMVEGDDRRPGGARRRLADEVLEQVRVPEMHAVEDADDDERRAELGSEGIDPVDDVHRARRQADRGRPPRGRRHEDLVRCEPAAGRGGDGDEPARRRRAAGSARPASGRPAAGPDELAAGDGRDLVVGQRDDRERVEAGVERPEDAAAGRPGSRRRRFAGRRGATASSSVNGPDAVRVRAPR